MSGRLFLVHGDDTVVDLRPSIFASEDMFQTLMERFPQLLTELDGTVARRWALIRREAGIPDKEGGAHRWSLDHLFLDDEGVPTLVEVKRASDTRTRREVVAQLLDYAANAKRWWSAEHLSDWYVTGQSEDCDPCERLAASLGKDQLDWDAYWRSVSTNLTAGRIRLVVVADGIPPELERIIEFLNEQMSPASFLGLELRLFENGPQRILAPRLIGGTTRALDQKAAAHGGVIETVEEWLAKQPDEECARAFSEGIAAVGARASVAGQKLAFDVGSTRFAYMRKGKVDLSLWMLRKHPRFADDSARSDLLSRFKTGGFKPSTETLSGEPSFAIPAPSDVAQWKGLLALFETLINQLK